MEGSQTLEAIFTSPARSDSLPSAPLRRISAHLSLTLFPHFIPARSRDCSSKNPNNMLFFSKVDIGERSMMGLKMTSNGRFISYTARPKHVL